ncbi:TetR family transcriptional regulator [Brevundimonas sp.]|uniref:TetR family transcriptional regulator n=1 Tax=Brevundimonas sp. TaxID=1871086 RepID=UPI00289DD714|nr:TetR family transcriptional regulator [Brevundimonas sp.]
MASDPDLRPSSSPPASERMMEAARRELAMGGLRSMSFRRLGEAAGTTAGALTYHLGAKAQILSDVVEAERARDRAWHGAWLARFTALDRLDATAVATLLEHYLEAISRDDARLTQMIWTDLLLRAPQDGDLQALMRPWFLERRAFWSDLFDCRIADAAMWGLASLAYTVDEGVHSLALGHDADYRMLRRLAVERLSHRLDPARRGPLARAFSGLVERLDPGLDLPGRDRVSDLQAHGRRHDIALAACGLLLDEGVDGVTHRAVGERAGIPGSTVAYHFRAAADLTRSALAMVYLVAQGRAPAPAPDSFERRGAVVVRGTLYFALAAARNETLAAQAIDLRRLRGENYVHTLREEGWIHVDGLDGQVAALAGIGAAALSSVDGENRFDALRSWLLVNLRG